jgi:uncharacterized protein (DUF58 family)
MRGRPSLNKELDVVRGVASATAEGKLAWARLARAGWAGGDRFMSSLQTGRSFLLQGPSPLVAPTTCLLEIRDADDRVAYTIQEDLLHPGPVNAALRDLYALVAKSAEDMLDDTLQELGVKVSS